MHLLKAKKDLLNAVEQGDVRLRLVNEKLAEVEMSQLNKEVRMGVFRQSTCLMTLTSILNRCRSSWRKKIGGVFWRRLKRSMSYSGLMTGNRSSKMRILRRCGTSWAVTSCLGLWRRRRCQSR